MPVSSKLRVASWQYFLHPIQSFDDFRAQVSGLVEVAQDYRSRVVVLPEYFTAQLLLLGDTRRPVNEQVRELAEQEEKFVSMMADLARKSGLYIIAGTIPSFHHGNKDVYNKCHVFSPDGGHGYQLKLHMTRFEDEEWKVESGSTLRVFEADFGKFAIAICYDVEFPEIAREAARKGAHMLFVPSCTDDRQGFYRVRYCAQARAIENHMFVVNSGVVGSQPRVPAVSLNYGQASILTPCDYAFARDGILAEGTPNIETVVIGDLDLTLVEKGRTEGTVLPLRDSYKTSQLIGEVEEVLL